MNYLKTCVALIGKGMSFTIGIIVVVILAFWLAQAARQWGGDHCTSVGSRVLCTFEKPDWYEQVGR